MKIGVNARLLTRPYTGIGQVTKNLVSEVAKIDGLNEYALLVHEAVDKKVAEVFPSNVKITVLPEKRWPSAGMRKTWWEQVQVPKYFREIGVDLAWFTYPCNPWFDGWYKRRIKTVVTVHDCIPWKDKRYVRGVLSKLYNFRSGKAVKKADLILTVSGSSLKDIVKICGVEKDKIEVIYNDVSLAYKEMPEDGYVKNVLNRFSLKPEQYFLYVGGYDVRKNVQYLVKEHAKFCEEQEVNYPLVMAGEKLFKNKLYASFASLGMVIKTGFLKQEELNVLYRNCLGFVSMSQEEGFNIPILEAANGSAPLVLSDISVHREIAEDSAIYVKIGEGALAKTLKDLLDEDKRDVLKNKSAKLAKRYSWQKYAKIVQELFRKL